MDNSKLKLSIVRVLLGAIDKDFRGIAYEYDNYKITIFVYIDREHNNNDFELIDIAMTEIIGDFPEIQAQEIKFIHTDLPIGKLNAYQGFLYFRYEAWNEV